MSFSAEWLALREPVDRAARSRSVAQQVRAHFRDAGSISVIDLGCGTGSNLRSTFALLPRRQEWLLVDYDPALLTAARAALSEWADEATIAGDALALRKDDRLLSIRFRQMDLSGGVRDLLDRERPDLVTASALFDLIAADWMRAFARDVAAAGAAFYTVLTYDGRDTFTPAHPMNEAVSFAFTTHQLGDKGFGPAAGPDAPRVLAAAFTASGYAVSEGDSPWRVGSSHADMGRQLLTGIAGAVQETGRCAEADVAAWLEYRLASLKEPDGLVTIGHTDTFARRG